MEYKIEGSEGGDDNSVAKAIKKTPTEIDSIKIKAVIYFIKTISRQVETFDEFDKIVRDTINYKNVLRNEFDFRRIITKYGAYLK